MINHPNRSRRKPYRVIHIRGASDKLGEAHFAVTGPNVDYFSVAAAIARLLETTLNAAVDFGDGQE